MTESMGEWCYIADRKEQKGLSHLYPKRTLIDWGQMRQRFNILEGVCYVLSGMKLAQHFIKKTMKPTILYGGGTVMVWDC